MREKFLAGFKKLGGDKKKGEIMKTGVLRSVLRSVFKSMDLRYYYFLVVFWGVLVFFFFFLLCMICRLLTVNYDTLLI